MGLLDTPQPVDLVISTEQKQRRAAIAIEQNVRRLYKMMVDTYVNGMKIVWENPAGLTPQQVLDGIGTKSVELFTLSNLLRDTVNAAQPGTLPEPTMPAYTANPDGTITLGSPDTSSSSS